MRYANFLLPLVAAILAAGVTSVAAGGDAALGEKVFMKCKVCHDAAEGKNKIGPTLKGLFGRPAGTAPGYSFSDAMKNSGITWDKEKLEAYLAEPKALVPGTKMSFAGLKKPEDIENLIAYLEQVTK